MVISISNGTLAGTDKVLNNLYCFLNTTVLSIQFCRATAQENHFDKTKVETIRLKKDCTNA